MDKNLNKIRIAITQDTRILRCRLLIKLIQLCGAEPVLIPFILKPAIARPYPDTEKASYQIIDQATKQHLVYVEDILSTCDALILPGNKYDIPPWFYGATSIHNETKKRLPQDPFYIRFETEMTMVKYALQSKWPILAICGGMQVINVVLGGSLIQHLPDDKRIDINKIHHRDKQIKVLSRIKQLRWEKLFDQHITIGFPKNIYPATHGMRVAPDSTLAKIYKETYPDIDLNYIGELSIHHQGCFEENLGRGLKSIAWAPDGVVEAAELTTYSNMCLLTQFHLECNVSGIAKSAVQQLVNAVTKK